MKRPLQIVGQPGPLAEPVGVRLGATLISVRDTGDGFDAQRFAALLQASGGVPAMLDEEMPQIAVVVRSASASRSRESIVRAQRLEEAADVVLGSARPAFAQHLALASNG